MAAICIGSYQFILGKPGTPGNPGQYGRPGKPPPGPCVGKFITFLTNKQNCFADITPMPCPVCPPGLPGPDGISGPDGDLGTSQD